MYFKIHKNFIFFKMYNYLLYIKWKKNVSMLYRVEPISSLF